MDESAKPCLVLSRREGEAIHIGDDVVVEVVHTGKTVKLAIRAPRETSVVRGELVGGSDKTMGSSPPV